MSGRYARATGGQRIESPVLRIGKGRLSFPNLIEPEETENGERYSTTILLPPDYDVRFILDALNAVCLQVWGKDKSRWPSTARRPEQVVRRCEEKPDTAGYEPGWHFLRAASKEKPNIVSWDPNIAVTDAREVYAGRWANISVRPFCYNNKSVGVSLGLNNVQLLNNDTPFGRTRASQDFDVEAADIGADF